MIRRLCIVRDDSGLTLVELLIASALAAIIMVAALNMLDSGSRTERATEARHTVQLAMNDAMTRISKEIRQASALGLDSTPSLLDMQTLLDGNLIRVIYDVNGTNFRRTLCANTDLAATCGGTAQTLISRFSTTVVPFCYDPDGCTATSISTTPQKIRVTLTAEAAVFSGGPITQMTEVDLRNANN